MISTKITTYCHGDFSKVQNFQEASIDNHQVWFVFHKNLLSGVGRLSKKTLQGIGKYYGVNPEELVFMRKCDIREIEKTFPATKRNPHGLNMVFFFWTKLYPNRLFKDITEEEYEELYRSVRRLRILWNQMKARCYNENAQDYHNYGEQGIRVCRDWLEDSDNFVLWALQKGYRYYPEKAKGDQLSIDRIDPTRNYQPSNCRWIPQRENCARTRGVDWDFVIDRAYHFARLFPRAADLCYGRARIDWKMVRDEYMGGDTSRLVQFLKDNCYCPMSIWRIRKALGDVIPQKKSERV